MSELDKKTLTIVFPALNEGAHIKQTLTDIYFAAKKVLDAFEIIVVDDGSTDNTYAIASSLQDKLASEIKLIRKETNEGVAAALTTALNLARFQYITWIPSDGAYRIDEIELLFSNLGSAPIILGYRANLNKRPLLRRFFSTSVTSYVRLLTHKKINDAHGIVIISVPLIKSFLMPYFKYGFQMQLLACFLNRGVEFTQYPVYYSSEADNHSTMLRVPVLIDMIRSAVNLFMMKLSGKLS